MLCKAYVSPYMVGIGHVTKSIIIIIIIIIIKCHNS